MANKLAIYIFGDFKSGAADGLAEFSYQNVQLLKDHFTFNFIEFDAHQNQEYHHQELREGIQIYRFGNSGVKSYQLPKALKTWLRSLDKTNILFHLHHIYNLTNYAIARILVKLSLPYLITPHDAYVYCASHQKNRPLGKRIYRTTLNWIFDKYVLDHATLIHALTPQCNNCLKELTKTPVKVVANQVNDMGIAFDPNSLRSDVCYIGRFSIEQKGIDRALRGFGLFKKTADTQNVRFVMIGPAVEAAVQTREQLVKELDLTVPDDVFFTGKVSESDRNNLLSHSKVYMQMSRYEGFGLSVAQALSCYKPVIISKQIPISGQIINHKAGYVVDTTEEAAAALKELFSLSESDYLQMSNNARTCYEKEFYPSVIRPQLIDLYESAFEMSN
ncbi:MAG TPA: glycosyltransferase [Mucilaginibacter sp.]|jgi:glycosyltransferase involved in cell wall biosynthesis|nr:glycosyltransferase [Mucilaginibacter sp.]